MILYLRAFFFVELKTIQVYKSSMDLFGLNLLLLKLKTEN